MAARYDVGGRSLFLVCVGPTASDLPTVIAESGLGGDSSHFGPLVPLLAQAPFRSCAYDRAGMGQSDPPAEGADPGPGPVTIEDGVRDLRALLAKAGIGPPYVLLGWSIGGWYVQAFANDHPDEVAGIVLIDATHPDEVARLSAVLPPARPDEDPRIAEVRQLIANIELDPPSAEIGWIDLATSGEQARSAGDLGDLPLIVLSQGRPDFDIGLPGLTPARAVRVAHEGRRAGTPERAGIAVDARRAAHHRGRRARHPVRRPRGRRPGAHGRPGDGRGRWRVGIRVTRTCDGFRAPTLAAGASPRATSILSIPVLRQHKA